MEDNEKHIKQQPGDAYPKPEIPADSAWSGMKDMLNQEMPVSTNSTFEWIKIIKLSSLVTVTCVGLVYFIMKNADVPQNKINNNIAPKTVIRTKQEQSKVDSKESADTISTKAIQELDSGKISEVKKLVSTGNSPAPGILNGNISNTGNSGGNSALKAKTDEKTTTKIRPSLESPKRIHRNDVTSAKGGQENHLENTFTATEADNRKRSLSNNRQVSTPAFLADTDLPNKQVTENQPGDSVAKNSPGQKNRKITIIRQNASTVPADPVKESAGIMFVSIPMLDRRPFINTNNLAGKLKSFAVKSAQATTFESKKSTKGTTVLKNIHAGLLWNVPVPFSGYGYYFKGTNNTNELYKIFIPGIWVGKAFANGSEILAKVRPFTHYFGNANAIDSSRVMITDTSRDYHTISRGLIKSSGFNLGIQYNQPVYDRLSIGIGTNMQWQRKALLSNHVKSSSRIPMIDYTPLISLSQKSDTSGYLKPFFLTANLEVLYSWEKLQFGAGVTLPITSMTSSPNKQRPVSGQVTVRWWVR